MIYVHVPVVFKFLRRIASLKLRPPCVPPGHVLHVDDNASVIVNSFISSCVLNGTVHGGRRVLSETCFLQLCSRRATWRRTFTGSLRVIKTSSKFLAATRALAGLAPRLMFFQFLRPIATLKLVRPPCVPVHVLHVEDISMLQRSKLHERSPNLVQLEVSARH